MTSPCPIFDADNHYYEAADAFTRHLDPRLGRRVVQWAEIDGRRYHVVAGRVSRAVSNPTFDPIAKPGALYDYFRGNPDDTSPLERLREREPIPAAYRDPAARLEVMDAQGLEGVWLFPTLGVLYEELLKHDPEAVTLAFTAFNRWLEEDWGFAHQGRIFGAPYLSLCDVGWAVKELEWALERGARVIVMRPSAVTTTSGTLPPTHEQFDPFWARVQEAGVTTVIHAGDSGYTTHGYARDGFGADFGSAGMARPSLKVFNIERAAYDFLLCLAYDRIFERFPGLRVASVENGSQFLPDLFRKLASAGQRYKHWFQRDPAETFRRHVWINPFWEDDVNEVVDLMGADRVIFGSDWPHIEGLPQPRDYEAEVAHFDAAERARILYENGRELTERSPA